MRPTTSNANTDSLLAMAVSHHQAGRLGEAEALYRQTLGLDPTNADALHLLGLVTLTRDPVEATQLIAKALKKAPKNILFLSNLAKAQNAAGENSKAVNTLKRVIKLDPKNDAAMNSLGVLYAGLRDQRKAEYTLRQAIKIRPDHGEYWNNLGLILSASDKKTEAIEALEQGLKIAPDYPVLLNSIGAVHRDMEHLEESINMLEKAIAKAPTYFEAISNLGVSLNDAGRYEAAIEKFEAALELNPEHGETWRGLSKPLMTLGHKARALEACGQAMKLAPGNIIALWERALVNLLSGDFEAGWSDYRARPMVNRKKWPPPDNPVDQAADLSGRHFVLMGEQGLGEELFFLRFAARLKENDARITACIDERLVPMVQRMGFVDAVQSKTTPPPKDGEHILIGDLGWFAGWGDVTPPPVAIAALEENAELIRQRLKNAGPGPYTALTWRAGTKGPTTLYKVAPKTALALAVKDLPGTVIALQRNPIEGEIESLSQELDRKIADFTDLNDDLESMLALMEQIDRYACVSNTNLHLAAAAMASGAALQCHVLVPAPAEFRWLADGEFSPWFPNMALYREDPAMDGQKWDGAMHALKDALKQ